MWKKLLIGAIIAVLSAGDCNAIPIATLRAQIQAKAPSTVSSPTSYNQYLPEHVVKMLEEVDRIDPKQQSTEEVEATQFLALEESSSQGSLQADPKPVVQTAHYERFFQALKAKAPTPASTSVPVITPSTASPQPSTTSSTPAQIAPTAAPQPVKDIYIFETHGPYVAPARIPLPEPLPAETEQPIGDWQNAHRYTDIDRTNPYAMNDHRTPGPIDVYIVNKPTEDLRDERAGPSSPPTPPSWRAARALLPTVHDIPVPPPSSIPASLQHSAFSAYESSIEDELHPVAPLMPVPLRDILPLQATLVDELPARLTKNEIKDQREAELEDIRKMYG